MIYRITENWEDAKDALQDCLLSAYIHLESFDGRSSFSTWLTRIGINSALMLIRKRRNSRTVSLDTLDELGPAATVIGRADQDPERQYLEQERTRALQMAIRSLRPAARQIVEINQLQEHSLRETAERMGMSISATKTRLFQAKKALRKSPKLRLLSRRQDRQPVGSFSDSQAVSLTKSLEAA
jgi:RNA polymerase sigma-70 factor (ECF subfamily)